MGLYVPHAELGWIPSEAQEIDRCLREGKPDIGWRGDPSLFLAKGFVTDRKGRPIASKWEVWRRCEDGKDRCIGWWDEHELPQVLIDLVRMDPRSPAHRPVIEQLEEADRARERAAEDRLREALAPIIDHGVWVQRNLLKPRGGHLQGIDWKEQRRKARRRKQQAASRRANRA